MLAQKSLVDGLPLSGERQRTGDFLEIWLENSAGPRVRPETLRRYAEIIRLHIIPELGKVPLTRLTPLHVENMLMDVGKKGASPRTIDHCKAVLRNVLQHALKHSLVGRNVAALADGPQVPNREVEVLTTRAAQRILYPTSGDRLEALFSVAIALELRQSETLGLRWSDVNMKTSTIRVQRTLQRVNRTFMFF